MPERGLTWKLGCFDMAIRSDAESMTSNGSMNEYGRHAFRFRWTWNSEKPTDTVALLDCYKKLRDCRREQERT